MCATCREEIVEKKPNWEILQNLNISTNSETSKDVSLQLKASLLNEIEKNKKILEHEFGKKLNEGNNLIESMKLRIEQEEKLRIESIKREGEKLKKKLDNEMIKIISRLNAVYSLNEIDSEIDIFKNQLKKTNLNSNNDIELLKKKSILVQSHLKENIEGLRSIKLKPEAAGFAVSIINESELFACDQEMREINSEESLVEECKR